MDDARTWTFADWFSVMLKAIAAGLLVVALFTLPPVFVVMLIRGV